jgi:hypothetical protein
MDNTTERYRGYTLAAVETADGWKIRIEETGQMTVSFFDMNAALREARLVIDYLLAKQQK